MQTRHTALAVPYGTALDRGTAHRVLRNTYALLSMTLLFSAAVGAVSSVFFAGRFIGHLGARRASLITGLVLCSALGSALLISPLIAWATGGRYYLARPLVPVAPQGHFLRGAAGRRIPRGRRPRPVRPRT